MLRQALIAALAVLTMFFVNATAHADEVVVKENTDVFDQPDGGTAVRTIKEGTMLEVGECGGSLCPILAGPGKGGWVRASALDFNPGAQNLARKKAPAGYPREVQVLSDVDIYDKPGGGGAVLGVLRQGTTTLTRKCRSDNWCPIAGGWVWGDFLAR